MLWSGVLWLSIHIGGSADLWRSHEPYRKVQGKKSQTSTDCLKIVPFQGRLCCLRPENLGRGGHNER